MEKENTLTAALQKLEKVEANLVKLERLWEEISGCIPEGIAFGDNLDYQDKRRAFEAILPYLPKIDGWAPSIIFFELNDIAQTRFDYIDIGEPFAGMQFDEEVLKPGAELRKYRFLLNQKRAKITGTHLLRLIEDADKIVLRFSEKVIIEAPIETEEWFKLQGLVDQMETLLGSAPRPRRWNDLRRHIAWAKINDASDIINKDWPTVKQDLAISIYTENEPIPVDVDDLATLVAEKPVGPIPKCLQWEKLTPEDFERLIFSLICTTPGYQNWAWLTKTNAADKGRDLSVEYIHHDPLNGTSTKRIIIQCKHYLNTSISMPDVAILRAQMALWQPPTVNVCIVATSGRFTSDAIEYIEKENQKDTSLQISMWPESHLESLLAKRPDLIAEFKLR